MTEVNKRTTPNYVKIQNFIIDKIKNGEYAIGSQIPPEAELARTFSVSRVTANKAVTELSLMGILERVRGKGSFVCSTETVETPSQAFSAVMKINTTRRRAHELTQFRMLPSCPELAERIGVDSNETFYEIVRSNLDEEGSYVASWDYTYIPHSIAGDLTLSFDYLRSCYIHEFLRTLPEIHPKFIKVFVNTPCYSFLKPALERFENEADVSVWSSVVYDGAMRLLAVTYTIYSAAEKELPLFTFSV